VLDNPNNAELKLSSTQQRSVVSGTQRNTARMNEIKSNTQTNIPKLTFTRQEAAAALGLSVVTIDRLTERGLLKANRATRRPLYSRIELNRFADGVPAKKKTTTEKI